MSRYHYILPLFLPLFSFVSLFFVGPLYKKHNDITKLVLSKISSCIMLLNLLLISLIFVFDRTVDIVTDVSFFSFYKSHVNSISDNIVILNSFVNPNSVYFVNYSLLFDSLTIIMLFVVIGVSALVQMFSTEYMRDDLYLTRFFAYLNFFSLCMLTLVTAGNFVQMFIGWEGVGVASFLLIGFWFSRSQAAKCALKAVIINRVGDCSLLMAFSIIGFSFNDFSYLGFFNILYSGTAEHSSLIIANRFTSVLSNYFAFYKTIFLFGFQLDLLFAIGLFILIGAFAKSAQFGLHTWLPDAMEGPTPVSALIHAATMVTAGVFLIIRCSPLFYISSELSNILLIFGSLTALFGASVAASQFDIKKIIAYSTCSQLGYMIAASGASKFDLSIFHLTTHAFFKAGLFLCAGLIIHALGDEQDIRKMGGIVNLMPVTYMSVFICSFCLAGLPFFSGFYSKDAIIEAVFGFDSVSRFCFSLLMLGAFFTILYSVRFFYYVFWKSYYSGSRSKTFLIGETSSSSFAVLVLSFVSIFFGYYWVFGNFKLYFSVNSIGNSMIFSLSGFINTVVWENPHLTQDFIESLFYFPQSLPFSIFLLLVGVLIFSFVFIFIIKPRMFSNKVYSRHVYNFFAKAWLYDIFLAKLSRTFFYTSRGFFQRNLENGLFEYVLVMFSVQSLFDLSLVLKHWSSGKLSTYIISTILGGFLITNFSLLFILML
jgi:proton-translocating NADH-quinone oxidoreductase chain L